MTDKLILSSLMLFTGAYAQQAIHGSRIYDGYTGMAILNDSATGTNLNLLAKYGPSPNTAVVAGGTDTKGLIGIVISGAGTTGTAWIATAGTAVPCAFDGGVTYRNYVVASTTSGGKCHDAGSAYPASGAEVLGKIVSATNASAAIYNIDMTERQASTAAGGGGGGTISPVSNLIKGDGTGNGADSGISALAVWVNNGSNTAGPGYVNDSRAASHTLPFKTDLFANIPATCTIGEKFFASDKVPQEYNCTTANNWTQAGGATSNIRHVGVQFDGGGAALSGTTTRCGLVTFSGTIVGGTLAADQSGVATVDVKTVAYSSYTGPSSASSITAFTPLALSNAIKLQDATLAGWSTQLPANSIVCFALSNSATVTWLNASITVAVN